MSTRNMNVPVSVFTTISLQQTPCQTRAEFQACRVKIVSRRPDQRGLDRIVRRRVQAGRELPHAKRHTLGISLAAAAVSFERDAQVATRRIEILAQDRR